MRSESGHSQGLSEAILGCLPSSLRSFPGRWNISVVEEITL